MIARDTRLASDDAILLDLFARMDAPVLLNALRAVTKVNATSCALNAADAVHLDIDIANVIYRSCLFVELLLCQPTLGKLLTRPVVLRIGTVFLCDRTNAPTRRKLTIRITRMILLIPFVADLGQLYAPRPTHQLVVNAHRRLMPCSFAASSNPLAARLLVFHIGSDFCAAHVPATCRTRSSCCEDGTP